MIVTKKRRNGMLAVALSAAGVLLGLQANNAQAVITYNFDVNGATAGFGVTTATTYDWDSATNGGFWSNNSTSTTGATATNGWVQGNFPKFQPAGTPTYIVTVSNDEQVTGIFASTAQNLTINAIGSGDLNAIAGVDGFLGSGSATTTINAPITGAGQLSPSNGGNIFLNGTNSYTGGTTLTSTATLIHFNNASAFGTNTITNNVATVGGYAPVLGAGAATITLPNNFANGVSGSGINFAADANTPVISSGTWTLGANNLLLRNNAVSTSPLTLSGPINGTAGVTVSGANGGTIVFLGVKAYTGTTTVGVAAATNFRFKLGIANAIAASTGVTLAGGTLDPGGFNQDMSSLSTLGMTAGSIIDYVAGASEVDFKNSSALTWTGNLNLANWDYANSTTKLRFGTDATGLSAAQLAQIRFNGGGAGTAALDSNGFVVPEPATAALLLLGAPLLLARRRRSC